MGDPIKIQNFSEILRNKVKNVVELVEFRHDWHAKLRRLLMMFSMYENKTK